MSGRRTVACILLPFAAILSLGACESAILSGDAGNPDRGRDFAEANCAACHAVGTSGESPYAAAPPFRSLSERYPVENLAEALAEGIGVTHGGVVEMPEFVLSPEEIDNLLAYLTSVQR